jgi:thiamine-phosphate pyrophosphorylase
VDPPTLQRLCAILDVDVAAAHGHTPADLLQHFLDGGARFIQLRAKQLASQPFLELCDVAVKKAMPYHATVVVNDRVDLARMAGAAGAHVGQDDLPAAAARRLLGETAVLGLSTHTDAQVSAALAEPISYVAVGPVFGTRTKDTGYEAVGLELVRQTVRRAGPIPVVAIGGIALDTAASVIDAGAASVAVITDLVAGGDPRQRVAAYLRRLG